MRRQCTRSPLWPHPQSCQALRCSRFGTRIQCGGKRVTACSGSRGKTKPHALYARTSQTTASTDAAVSAPFPISRILLTATRLQHVRARKMRWCHLHRLPERVPTRPGSRVVCAVFCQPFVHVPALHGPSDGRPEKVRSALPLQNGRIHEEHAARERAIHAHDAANSMCVNACSGSIF